MKDMQPKPDNNVDVAEARKWLGRAIARHERHMDGTESTSESSQQKMMDEMTKAMFALGAGTKK